MRQVDQVPELMSDDPPKGQAVDVVRVDRRPIENHHALRESRSLGKLRKADAQNPKTQAQGVKNISVSILVNIFAVKDDGCHATVVDPQEVEDIGHSEIAGTFRALNRPDLSTALNPQRGGTDGLPVFGSSQQSRQSGPGGQASQRSRVRMDDSCGRISHPLVGEARRAQKQRPPCL